MKNKILTTILIGLLAWGCEEGAETNYSTQASSDEPNLSHAIDDELDSIGDSQTPSAVVSQHRISSSTTSSTMTGDSDPLFTQDFEPFNDGSAWYLTDFGLGLRADKDKYISVQNEILFDISWTKRTRNKFSDIFDVPKPVSRKKAAELCDPKIEVGQAKTYNSGGKDNYIAELDTDLRHCGVNKNESANIRLRSFIPTKKGHRYLIKFDQKMRPGNRPAKNLVVAFGDQVEKYDLQTDAFVTESIEITAKGRFTRLVFRDNGLPDTFGALIDNIKIYKLGKSERFSACEMYFAPKSRYFRKCMKGKIDPFQDCNLDSYLHYCPGDGVVDSRMDTTNFFVDEPAQNGNINFLSLGLGGYISSICEVDRYPAAPLVYGKTLRLREISWNNVSYSSYPEKAIVKMDFIGCEVDELNGWTEITEVKTNELLEYEFSMDSEGRSYEGCRMKKIVVEDVTPDGPSKDGFDINSFELN